MTSIAIAASFRSISTVCVLLPLRTPRQLISVRMSSVTTASSESGMAMPVSVTTYFANVAATAAIPPDCTISSSAHPYMNATEGWYASRRYAYCPPTSGRSAASSAYANAPSSAMTPPAAHAPTISAGVCTDCATTYGLMKMPEPMMPPMTIMVASNAPRRRASVGVVTLTRLHRIERWPPLRFPFLGIRSTKS